MHYFCCSLFLLHRQKEWKQHHNGNNSHKLQKKIQQCLAPGIIKPEICRLSLIPTDNGCTVGERVTLAPGLIPASNGFCTSNSSWEGNIDVIGTPKRCLKMIIPKR